MRNILGLEYHAHDAQSDALALQELMYEVQPSPKIKRAASFSTQNAKVRFEIKLGTDATRLSLQRLVKATGIPVKVQKNLAANGLTEEHLKNVYRRDGKRGIRTVFTSLIDGKPRITDDQMVVSVVSFHLKEQLDHQK